MTDESARDDAALYEIAVGDRSAAGKRFDDFTTGLAALCVEHGVRITGGRDYDDYSMYLELATEDAPAGCEVDFVECVPPTPEEIAAEEARQAAAVAELAKQNEEARARYLQIYESPAYKAKCAEDERNANRSRSDYMRVSIDPSDPCCDERPRRVWVNEVEIGGWISADEFRRCVVTATGVVYGAVRIEQLGEPGAPVVETPIEASSSLAGMLVPVPKSEPVVEVAEVPVPTFAVPMVPVTAAPRVHLPNGTPAPKYDIQVGDGKIVATKIAPPAKSPSRKKDKK